MTRFSLLIALCVVFSASALFGQADSGTIVGTVTDQGGAVVPGAKVTLIHEATKFARTVTANGSGQYVANAFPTGKITATVEQAGFEHLVRSGLELTAADILTVDLQLVVGSTQQTVEVTGQAPLLQSQTAAISSLVTNQQIIETPLNGRNFTQLIPLTTGASPSSPVMSAPVGANGGQRANVAVSVNGSVANNNTYLLDGVTNRDLWMNYMVMVPTADTIQEVRVMTSNYSAEYGAAAGAITLVQTKSGTNGYHGSLYEFLRNSDLDANTFFNNRAGVAKAPFHRNEFGGVLGGPIRHDKTFFFADYQGTRIIQPSTSTQTLPTVAQRLAITSGNFSPITTATIYNPYSTSTSGSSVARVPFPGNQIPSALLDPVAGKLIGLLPAPMSPAATLNFTNNPVNEEYDNQMDVRIDQIVSGTDRMYLKFSVWRMIGQGTGSLPAAPNPIIPVTYLSGGNYTDLLNWSTMFNYTKIIGANKVNEIRVAVVRPRYDDDIAQGERGPLADQLGISGINVNNRQGGLPSFAISGYATIGNTTQFPDSNHTLSQQYEDVLTVSKGSHTLKFGGRYIRHDFNGYSDLTPRGAYTFVNQFTKQINGSGGSALADFALGAFNAVTRSVQKGVFGLRMWETGFFAEDAWRATNRLTITYGLRHEMQSPPREVNDQWANFNAQTGQFMVAGITSDQQNCNCNSQSLRRLDDNNFAPRLGITYMLTRDNKTVLRAGSGFSYVESFNTGKQLYQNPPMSITQAIQTDINGAPPFTIAAGLPVPPQPDLSPGAHALLNGYAEEFDPGLKDAKSMQWSASIQRELLRSVLLDVAYVGTRTLDMINSINANQPVPGPGDFNPRRPLYSLDPLLGDVDLRTNYGSSKYESLQVNLRKQFGKGLSASLAYTWSHNLTNTRQPNSSTRPENSYCSACDWGNAPEDRRQMVVINHVYQLPFGTGREYLNKGVLSSLVGNWDISGIWTMYTGQYTAPSLSAPVSNATTTSGQASATERPNCVGISPLMPDGQRTISTWLNPAAFATPAVYTFGNCGMGTLRGPGFFNVDLGIHRDFRIREKWQLAYRLEMFNSLNRANFGAPAASFGTATFGQISSTQPARVMQMALKLTM